MIEKHPSVVDKSIDHDPNYREHLLKLIGKKQKVVIDVKNSASILMTKFGLS